eukprot:6203950-Pleurochrysis_carterae.AAC.1
MRVRARECTSSKRASSRAKASSSHVTAALLLPFSRGRSKDSTLARAPGGDAAATAAAPAAVAAAPAA